MINKKKKACGVPKRKRKAHGADLSVVSPQRLTRRYSFPLSQAAGPVAAAISAMLQTARGCGWIKNGHAGCQKRALTALTAQGAYLRLCLYPVSNVQAFWMLFPAVSSRQAGYWAYFFEFQGGWLRAFGVRFGVFCCVSQAGLPVRAPG
jgi:hypothetical protein